METARAGRRPQVPIAVGVAMLCLLGVLSVLTSSGSAAATAASLRFGGATQFGLDRLLIPVDNPPTSADIGATDFTIEFWMKGTEADNSGGSVGCNTNGFLWINGRIIVDRDRLASGGRDFGISVTTSGRVTFGVENASGSSYTICSSTSIDVLDNAWHHVAVQRRRSDGRLRVFVDGSLEATATGPTGDVSYPDGAVGAAPDPYFVIGAEKHDIGRADPVVRRQGRRAAFLDGRAVLGQLHPPDSSVRGGCVDGRPLPPRR